MGLLESLLLVLKIVAGALMLVVQMILAFAFYLLPITVLGILYVEGYRWLVSKIGRWRTNLLALTYLLAIPTLLIWLYTNYHVIDLTQYWPS